MLFLQVLTQIVRTPRKLCLTFCIICFLGDRRKNRIHASGSRCYKTESCRIPRRHDITQLQSQYLHNLPIKNQVLGIAGSSSS
jgi:hypothetical protein